MLKYAQDVASDAKSYVNSIQKAKDDEKEKEALARMGMPGEPVAV